MKNFEEMSPKEIITCAMIEIAECMKHDGFCYNKNKLEIRKEFDFMVSISPQINRNNRAGKECFWSKGLAVSNKKQDSFCWFDFYGIESYEQSVKEIKEIISQHFLPFIRRMEDNPMAVVQEVAEKGFCVFSDEPVYDARFVVPTAFLLRYGTHEQLTLSFQNYIDRHQLPYVKTNMQKAVALLKENKEVKTSEPVSKYLLERLQEDCDSVDVVSYPDGNPRMANIIGTILIGNAYRAKKAAKKA